jgi:EAL domain-containing protein (putative c-di-GMP-specific phosphodiesterase class I)/tetratricopeptide (TPR) repeat protein
MTDTDRTSRTPPAAEATSQDPARQIDLLLGLAGEQVLRDPSAAAVLASQARTQAERTGDRVRCARAVLVGSLAAVEAGSDPARLLSPSLDALGELTGADAAERSIGHLVVATLQYYLGVVDDAADHAYEAVRLARFVGDEALLAQGRLRLATVLASASPDLVREVDDLGGLFQEAIATFAQLGQRPEQATGLYNLGAVYLLAGRYEDAVASLELAARIMAGVRSSPWARVELLRALALARVHRGLEAEQLLADLGDVDGADEVPAPERVLAGLVRGLVHRDRGELERAGAAFERAGATAASVQDAEMQAECLRELSEVEELLGRTAAALATYREFHRVWAGLRSDQAARRLRGLQLTMRVEQAEQRSDAAVADQRRLTEDVDRARSQLAEAENRLRVEAARRSLAEQRGDGRTSAERATGLPGPEQALALVGRDPTRPVGVLVTQVDVAGQGDRPIDHDRLVGEMAARLLAVERPQDSIVVTLGGTVLAVVAVGIERSVTDELARRIHDALEDPMPARPDLRPTAWIGTAHGPDDGLGLNVLLRRARMALDAARRRSADPVQPFTAEVEDEHRLRRFVSEQLRPALLDGKVAVRYQPIVTVAEERIVGAEALVRWNDPDRGAIPTQLFVDIAEELGMVAELGRHVLLHACRAAAAWPAGADGVAPYVSVNASPQQLVGGVLLGQVDNALRLSGLAAERLVIEVTESRQVDLEQGRGTLEALRERGIRVRIDDFGIGYSNFGYLTTLPVDGIKLDRAFITASTSAEGLAVIEAIAVMARGLKLGVVAEGVETVEQRELLARHGVHHYQGWLFARDLASDEFAVRVRAQVSPPVRSTDAA